MDEDILNQHKVIDIEKWSIHELEEYIRKLDETKEFIKRLILTKKKHQLAANVFFTSRSDHN